MAQVGGERSVSYAVQLRTDEAPWVAALGGEGGREANCRCRRSFTDFVSLHEQLAAQHPQLAAQLPKLPGARNPKAKPPPACARGTRR